MNFQKYTIDDFVTDPQFRSWVLSKSPSSDFDWEEWIRSNPEKRDEVMKARKLIEASVGVFEKISATDAATEVTKILELTKQSEGFEEVSKRSSIWRYLAAAASIVVILTSAWFFTKDIDEPKNMRAVSSILNKATSGHWMVIKNTETKNKLVVLPDGSTLLLKKDSRITFPSEFSENQRNVYLHGEAFFEVVKNASYPFVIYSNSFTTEVVGTSFMLTDFPDNKSNGIVVKTGIVRVFASAFEEDNEKRKANIITELRANQSWSNAKLVEQATPRTSKITNDDLVERIQSNPFKYRDEPLAEILIELEQTYSVKISYDKNEIGGLRLSATLGDEPFFRKLDLITMALDLDYTVNGNEIIISQSN